MWTKEAIERLLKENDRAVERGLVAIYHRQTSEEQNSKTTIHRNGMGFSGAHASYGSYLAKWILSGKHLNGNHLVKGRSLILHYTGQLLEVANQREAA